LEYQKHESSALLMNGAKLIQNLNDHFCHLVYNAHKYFSISFQFKMPWFKASLRHKKHKIADKSYQTTKRNGTAR